MNAEIFHQNIRHHVLSAQTDKFREGFTPELSKTIEQAIDLIEKVPVESFVEYITQNRNIGVLQVGSMDIERHGMSISVTDRRNKIHPVNMLVRLYMPNGLSPDIAEPLIDRLREMKPKQFLNIKNVFEKRTYLNLLTHRDNGLVPFHFAEAELAVRTMAHAKRPETNPLPFALVNPQGRAVGLVLEVPKAIVASRDLEIEITDTVFDFVGGETYGISKSLPMSIHAEYTGLRNINVIPYLEDLSDKRDMLLLDGNGRFVTFNRMGYVG